MLTLVLGGVRSGKSKAAERLAPGLGSRVVYIAPGLPIDAEMQERIRRHRERRHPAWETVEEALDIPSVIRRMGTPGTCFLLDDTGTWVTNLLLATPARNCQATVRDTLTALTETGAAAVVVSHEVGLGMVPATQLGRRFGDELGEINQLLAARADRVLLVVAGVPLDLRALEVEL